MSKLNPGYRAAALSVSMVLLAGLAHAGVVKAHHFEQAGHVEQQQQDEDRAEDEPGTPATASRPAGQFITDLMDQPGQGWQELDPWRMGATASWWPSGSGGDRYQPVLAASGTWRTDAGDVVLDVAIYPPGLGGVALEEKVDGLNSSTGELGAADHQVSGSWNGSAFSTRTWRHGDVHLSLSYAGRDDRGMAAHVDARALQLLGEVCTDAAGVGDQAGRSPLADEYTGLLTRHEVTIATPDLDARTSGALERDLEDPASVHLPARPTYPVWPELPAPVAAPAAPVHPGELVTAGDYYEQVEDRGGPGCGWDFTGAAQPAFDEDAARQQAQDEQVRVREGLQRAAEQWARDASDYAQAVDDYQDRLERHSTYADEVAQVRAAWDEIAVQWDAYYADLEAYEQAVEDSEAFEAEQDQAREDYERLVSRCAELAEEDEEDQGSQRCADLEAPDILGQDPPQVPDEPLPPPDPRPGGGDS